MSEATNDQFFSDFSGVDKQGWKDQIIKDLKGADYNEKLILKTQEGFDIEPFYNQEDLEHLKGLNQYQGWVSEAGVNSLSPRQWENRSRIKVTDLKEANKKALLALQNGSDGISFELSEPVDAAGLNTLLKDILLEYCAVSFEVSQPLIEFGDLLVSYATSNQYPLDKITGSLKGDISVMSKEELNQYAQLLSPLKSYQIFVIESSGHPVYTTIIGQMLADAISLINTLGPEGVNVGETIKKFAFSLNASNDYFKQIALLRALRMLVHLVVQQYGVNDFDPASINVQIVTTILVDEHTKDDPYMNMLSNTNQAMASIIGGCNVLTVLPHNQGIEEVGSFAERIARNVSSVLKDESYLDKVADPSAGSYYIENLTNQLAEKSWEECQRLLTNKE